MDKETGRLQTEGNVKQRLLDYLKYKRMSQKEFTDSIGVSSSYIQAIRRSISGEKMLEIQSVYPDLSRDWLLYGEGDMIMEEPSARSAEGWDIPLLPVAAYAGNLQMWSRGVREQECQRVMSPVEADMAIPISGDSMEPDFQDGATVVVKKINDKAFIPWGCAMVIDTENGVLLKDLYPDEGREDCIVARSRNQKYPPIRIPKSSVFGIYRVLCSLKMYPTM